MCCLVQEPEENVNIINKGTVSNASITLLVGLPAKAQDGSHQLVGVRLLPQGASKAGCSAVGAAAEIKCETKTILNQAEGG